jgi:hypothetical protein
MHKDAAGIATEAPIISRVAAMIMISEYHPDTRLALPTDVAPDRGRVISITVPDYRDDEQSEASYARPRHVETCPSVPSFKMPWERDGD